MRFVFKMTSTLLVSLLMGLSLSTIAHAWGSDKDKDPGPTPAEDFLLQTEDALTKDFIVSVDPEVTIDNEAKLRKALKGREVAVIALPRGSVMETYDEWAKEKNDNDGVSFEGIAEAVREPFRKSTEESKRPQYKTVVVLSGGTYRVNSNMSTDSISDLIEGTSVKNTEALIRNADSIQDWQEVVWDEWKWIPYILGGIVAIIVVIMSGAWLLDTVSELADTVSYKRDQAKRRKATARKAKEEHEAQEAELKRLRDEAEREAAERAKIYPADLHGMVANILTWSEIHIRSYDPTFAGELDELASRFELLFERIAERGNEHQREVAMIGYQDILTKLTDALSERYYLDIIQNPELWDDPEGRIALIEAAVAGASAQILENIKQVNAARDLEFQGNMQQLAAYLTGPQPEDLIDRS